jgi:hypothetical protein
MGLSTTEGGGTVRRKKRYTLVRVALGLAVVAAILPVSAQAKVDSGQVRSESGVIPYLSHGQGVDSGNVGLVVSPDDRNLPRMVTPVEPQVTIPYLSQGEGVTSAELGFAVSNAVDDRPFARSNSETTTVTSDGGWSIDANPYLMTGSALILLALGMGFALWYTRRTKLSPA